MKMVSKKSHEYFVNITDPSSLKRMLLESSKLTIHMLQDYERLKEVRRAKIELVQQVDKIMKEIRSLTSKLKAELPNFPQRKKASPEKKEVKRKSHIRQVIPKTKSPLEQLQDELDDVEKQLTKLS